MRRPADAFGWLDAHLLHDGWLARLGPDATAVLVLLAIAADRRGASFFGRRRMAETLSIDVAAVDAALAKLLDLHLVELRPWQPGQRDGVWQLMPVPRRTAPSDRPQRPGSAHPPPGAPTHIAEILAQIATAANRRKPAETDRR